MSTRKPVSLKDEGFGKAKPLPGQKGHKARQSELLEDEAKRMEERLQVLKEQLAREKEAREGVKLVEGSRWKSARESKGSIRGYGKEVKERTSSSKKQTSEQPVKVIKTAREWGVSDVCKWLEKLGIEQYGEIFANNQISGEVLLELSAEDLDYMGITIVAHRKRLLRAIEEVKQSLPEKGTLQATRSSIIDQGTALEADKPKLINGKPPPLALASLHSNSAKAGSGAGSTVNEAGKIAASSTGSTSKTAFVSDSTSLRGTNSSSPTPASSIAQESSQKVHWSQLKPISQNEVSGGGAAPPVNLADGDFNEEQSHNSFLEALMAWRTGGSSSSSTEIQGGNKAGAGVSTANESGGKSVWVNPFATPRDDAGSKQSARGSLSSGRTSLLNGTLDEAAEHLAFQKAVQQWRASGSNPSGVKGEDGRIHTPRVNATSTEGLSARKEPKASCWQCYKTSPASFMINDKSSGKCFCGKSCLHEFTVEAQASARRAAERTALASARDKDMSLSSARDVVLQDCEEWTELNQMSVSEPIIEMLGVVKGNAVADHNSATAAYTVDVPDDDE